MKTWKLTPSILYFGLVYAGYVLTLFVPSFRTGLFASALLVLIAVEIGLSIIKSDKKSDFISLINISVLGYVLYNLASFIWLTKNGFPVSVYVEEFSNSILPVLFYFVAVISIAGCKTDSDGDTFELVYKAFLYSFFVLSVISIIMYIIAPQFYCDYLVRISMISKADAATCHVRMEGFTGSTCMSYLAVAAMIASSRFMYKYATEKNTKKFVGYTLLFIFNLAVVFLANGRAGMVAAILVILYINVLVFYTFKFADKKYLYFEIGIIVALILIMCLVTPGIVEKIWARLVSLPGAVGQRSEQWIAAINNVKGRHGQWLGNGIGANGHKAIDVEGAHIVADGGLIKLYCEEGAIGFTLFVYIMISVFRAGVKNLKKYFAELGIIGTALLMSIGSNIIAFQLCIPIFWFAAGVVMSPDKTNKKGDM